MPKSSHQLSDTLVLTSRSLRLSLIQTLLLIMSFWSAGAICDSFFRHLDFDPQIVVAFADLEPSLSVVDDKLLECWSNL